MSGGHDHVGAGLVGILLQNPSRIEKLLLLKDIKILKTYQFHFSRRCRSACRGDLAISLTKARLGNDVMGNELTRTL